MSNALLKIVPRKTLVGIDSDGCVFDTMGVKQRTYFAPLIIKYWGLEPLREAVLKRVEFLNLASIYRGQNRFPNLLRLFDMLHELGAQDNLGAQDTSPASGDAEHQLGVNIILPPTEALRAYCSSGLPLGHPSLKAEVERTKDPELARVLEWSLAINKEIHDTMTPIPPFRWALKSLELMAKTSDIVVISQTPAEALIKEWRLHDIERFVKHIAGQEEGTKTEQLQKANGGNYGKGKTIMIGDAPGDAKAAKETESFFFPILPNNEETSWQRFHDEAYPLFLKGEYTEAYQHDRLAEFNACLPERM